jgi:hypothetical protein
LYNHFGYNCRVNRDVPTNFGRLGTNLVAGKFGLPLTSAEFEFPREQLLPILEEIFATLR